ncbi:Gfo/Idh/MocA family oxidoreductase [Flavobacterium crassostreae]|uniref:Gfo/Idh/MocA-like oxidoreductase C-terminal domain-containing protein n=1 Tax=Flavobacterium crassostreae TaxID=1763534 RepID=A0A1B9E5V2_9FLAO|nr:Gfo/Idh/MocA family oxidoreductase [Flavobacterium crassostreae]OCB77248.1 hypothetical protein LPBF_04410 [Flavobacterium crassostreae]
MAKTIPKSPAVNLKNAKTVRKKIPSLPGNYQEFYNGVSTAINHNKPMPVTPEQAVLVIQRIEAALQSNQQ